MGADIRKEALTLLSKLEQNRHTTLDQLLDALREGDQHVSRRDRALRQALVFGVLRARNRLDWVIRHFSRTPFRKIDPTIKNILRLGIYQLLYMDRIPASAAVHTAVELAKDAAAPWTVKFVNGLLRSVARNPTAVRFPEVSSDPVQAISIRTSLPKWIVARWLARWGIEECSHLCEALNAIPPLSVRANTLKTTRTDLITALKAVATHVIPTPHAPEGIALRGFQTELTAIPGFAEGAFQIQDEAAQLISHCLVLQPGLRVLDACAGLGGKTGHTSQLIDNIGEVVAVDTVDRKLAALEKEMQRLGIANVTTVRHDWMNAPDPDRLGTFDRVLLDAPSSGLGVLQRNPDTRWQRTAKDLKRYARRQQIFIDHLAPLVKPGGLLVYAVCSMEPEETDRVVQHFLNQNKQFTQVAIPMAAVHEPAALTGPDQCFRSFPHRHAMDGFFAVSLQHRI